MTIQLSLNCGRQALLVIRFTKELADTTTTIGPGRFSKTIAVPLKPCASHGSYPGDIRREIDGGSGRKLRGGNIRVIGGAMIARTRDDCPSLLCRSLLIKVGKLLDQLLPGAIGKRDLRRYKALRKNLAQVMRDGVLLQLEELRQANSALRFVNRAGQHNNTRIRGHSVNDLHIQFRLNRP